MNQLIHRPIIDEIKPWLDKHEIVVLLGARRAGKTSLIRLLIQALPEARRHLYLDLEDVSHLKNAETVPSFLNLLAAKGWDGKSPFAVFIDEIHHHPNPSNFLKLIHDHHPLVKLVVTGSSSFDILKKFKDHLTGRKIVFEIYPLTFQEFLDFTHHPERDAKRRLNLRALADHFDTAFKMNALQEPFQLAYEEFVVFGGYPEPVQTPNHEDKVRRLLEIHNSYLQKDIKDIAGIDNVLSFNRAISYWAAQIGGLVNIHEMSREIGSSRREIEYALDILQKTFVAKFVRPFSQNRQNEIRKMPKAYFIDSGMRNMHLEDARKLDLRPDRGHLIENAVLSELLKSQSLLESIYFWRTKEGSEVDFLLVKNRELLPVEVKYQTFVRAETPSGLKHFIRFHRPKRAVVITKNFVGRSREGKTEILFLPAWMV